MFKIGVDVFCTDTKVGKLIKVAIDPHTQRVTDLVIEKGLVLKEDRVIPVEVVEEVTDKGIRLVISSRELTNYPQYREMDFVVSDAALLEEMGYRPDESLQWASRYGIPMQPVYPRIRQRVHEGVSPERPVIGRGTRVRNATETIGYIDHLLVDSDSGRITHLVVRRGLVPFRAIIPMELVKSISDESVYVPLTRQELETLGKYTPRADADVLAEVQDRLAGLKGFDLSRVKVTLVDGVVRLAGSVADVLSKRRAYEIAEDVAGVLAVENEIRTDTEVEGRVVTALLSDPRTDVAIIEVNVEGGIVTLSGVVESQETKAAAEIIAEQQRGVVSVINNLEVSYRYGDES